MILHEAYVPHGLIRVEDKRLQLLLRMQLLNQPDINLQTFTTCFVGVKLKYKIIVTPMPSKYGVGVSETTARLYVYFSGDLSNSSYSNGFGSNSVDENFIKKPSQKVEIDKTTYTGEIITQNRGLLTTCVIEHDNTGVSPDILIDSVIIRCEITGRIWKFRNVTRKYLRQELDGVAKLTLISQEINIEAKEQAGKRTLPPSRNSPQINRRPSRNSLAIPAPSYAAAHSTITKSPSANSASDLSSFSTSLKNSLSNTRLQEATASITSASTSILKDPKSQFKRMASADSFSFFKGRGNNRLTQPNNQLSNQVSNVPFISPRMSPNILANSRKERELINRHLQTSFEILVKYFSNTEESYKSIDTVTRLLFCENGFLSALARACSHGISRQTTSLFQNFSKNNKISAWDLIVCTVLRLKEKLKRENEIKELSQRTKKKLSLTNDFNFEISNSATDPEASESQEGSSSRNGEVHFVGGMMPEQKTEIQKQDSRTKITFDDALITDNETSEEREREPKQTTDSERIEPNLDLAISVKNSNFTTSTDTTTTLMPSEYTNNKIFDLSGDEAELFIDWTERFLNNTLSSDKDERFKKWCYIALRDQYLIKWIPPLHFTLVYKSLGQQQGNDPELIQNGFQNECDKENEVNEAIDPAISSKMEEICSKMNITFDTENAFLGNFYYVRDLILTVECLQQHNLEVDKLILGDVSGTSISSNF